MPAQGGPWTPITDGVTGSDDKPRWAPDGPTIYFISNRDGRPEYGDAGSIRLPDNRPATRSESPNFRARDRLFPRT